MRRILSIDGGGIKGVFPASFLATVENTINGRIVDYFDLIAGTSTGGVIALGLGLGFSAADILALYESLGPSVFKQQGKLKLLRQFFAPRYNQEPLRNALQAQFADRKLGESSTRLVIPSVNLETGEVYVFKTAHDRRFERDYRVDAVDVALATAAAPTYFPAQQDASGLPLVDGGIWANNPMGMAVVEAIGVLDWPRDEIRILSLGCTTAAPRGATGRFPGHGYGYWAPRLVESFMTAQSSASSGTAAVLIGHESIMRVSPVVERGRFGLDQISEITSLKGLGGSEARKALPALRTRFLTTPAAAFHPYHSLTRT